MTAGTVAGDVTLEFRLPADWVAVDLTDEAWPAALTRSVTALAAAAELGQYREAIISAAVARAELMVATGAACLLLKADAPVARANVSGSETGPAATVIGAVFVAALPPAGLNALLAEFAADGWLVGDVELGESRGCRAAREVDVAGLAAITLVERIILFATSRGLVSIAFSSAVAGDPSRPADGINAVDSGITALLKGFRS